MEDIGSNTIKILLSFSLIFLLITCSNNQNSSIEILQKIKKERNDFKFMDSLLYKNNELYYKLFDNSFEAKQEISITTEFNSNAIIVNKKMKVNELENEIEGLFKLSKINSVVKIEVIFINEINRKNLNNLLISIIEKYETYIDKISVIKFKKPFIELSLDLKKELILDNELFIYVYVSNVMIPPIPHSTTKNSLKNIKY